MSLTNDWPIICVFSQPTTSTNCNLLNNNNNNNNCQYIAASYVKYLESAGARVIPIDYYSNYTSLDYYFDQCNGFFFPGGGATFPDSAQYIYDKTVKANDNNDFMPLWGTCMGFQWLLISQSRDINILDPKNSQMDSYNYSIPLNFYESIYSSKMFKNANKKILNILSNENVTMNNHHYGIYTNHFKSTNSLNNFFNILSVNKDRNGDEFISTIEAFNYPIYGTQWHPEKNAYEWNKVNGIPYEAINHSEHAIEIAQYTANFFVSETRKSNHKFKDPEEEDKLLIYNYQPIRTETDFVQTYYFNYN